MSSQLTVTQTIELLERLKGTAREFAGSEETLTREYRTRSDAAERRFAEQQEVHGTRLSTDLAQAEEAFHAAKTQLQRRYEGRKSRIAKAEKSSNRRALEWVDDREGRQKYLFQKGTLDTERGRVEALKHNDATLADFQNQMASQREAFRVLEEDARRAFRGYGKFKRQIATSEAQPDLSKDEYQLFEELQKSHAATTEELRRFGKLILPRLFSYVPLWLWIVLLAVCAVGLAPALQQLGHNSITPKQTISAALVAFVLVVVAYIQGQRSGSRLAKSFAGNLAKARRMLDACDEKCLARHASEIERIETDAKSRIQTLNQNWQAAIEEAVAGREHWPARVREKRQRAAEKHERIHRGGKERLESEHDATVKRLRSEAEQSKAQFTQAHLTKISKLKADYDAQWQKLEGDWKARIQPIYHAIEAANRSALEQFPEWQPSIWQHWSPPRSFKNAARFGRLEADLRKFAEPLPRDARLGLPGPPNVSIPLVLTYPQQGSILFETAKSGNELVIGALNNIIFRLLATSPAGKLSFTIIDPIKLGQNFSGVMHLADYEDNLINGRIWTQASQIEERLGQLNEHMEKVIQMYLRNEYQSIAEYNVDAGNIAEKYHFVVVADFPANFTDTAARRVLRIAASGARCGVYTLIHWDHRHTAPADFLPEELRKSSVCISLAGDQFAIGHPPLGRTRVLLDKPPDAEFATSFLQKVGESSRGSNRVEVPFTQIAPAQDELWTLDTTEELRVPIGRAGATKLQYLSIGKGTRQHALVAGKTGSGKSTLFHVIITNLALWCSPEQVEFYLVDFKKGVEFKGYAAQRLPHARVVAIESDREFGLSVLQKLDDELKRRGDLFRQLGVQDVAGYKKAGGKEAIPRSLLIIDEFQEFFVEDDRVSQAANVLLDRIVRQGRAFGIHVLLGSQTLGGAYTLARTTIGQMVIRIALQCNEADAYLIMDENNPAPRLLTRPGEGIYNDMAGMVEGNSPFQTVWLPDDDRDTFLERARGLAENKSASYPGPIVFEGNAPSDVSENPILRQLLDARSVTAQPMARIWLGAPNSIKGPTEAVFQKRSGNNLLIVGQREEAVLAIIGLALVSLAAQHPIGSAKFILFESTAPGSPERIYLERIVRAVPHQVVLARSGDLNEIINGLAEDLKARTEDENAEAPATYLFIHGLQNFKKFRQDDDFAFSSSEGDSANAAAQLQKFVTEGPTHGMHLIATLDTYNNVNRFLGRKALSEFEMRVLFQMSTNDSASLCDDPKASTLGLHRALLYNEQEGYLETFRPYALPGMDWIHDSARNLKRLLKVQ